MNPRQVWTEQFQTAHGIEHEFDARRLCVMESQLKQFSRAVWTLTAALVVWVLSHFVLKLV